MQAIPSHQGDPMLGSTRRWLRGCAVLAVALFLVSHLAAQADDTAKQEAMKKAEMMKAEMMTKEMNHGVFSGANGHTVSGGFEVVAADGKHWVKLGDDFSLDNAPDPY